MDRIRETLDVVRLRRRLHITTRDLLSTLAFIVAGNRTCEQLIRSRRKETARAPLLLGSAYNRLFAGAHDEAGESANKDRLLAEVGNLDVADIPQPDLDGQLWMLGIAGCPTEPADLASPDREQMATLWDSGVEPDRRRVHGYLRRKLYLEREDPSYLEMLPFAHLRTFLEALLGVEPSMTDLIANAITASEGLRNMDQAIVAVRMIDDLEAQEQKLGSGQRWSSTRRLSTNPQLRDLWSIALSSCGSRRSTIALWPWTLTLTYSKLS